MSEPAYDPQARQEFEEARALTVLLLDRTQEIMDQHPGRGHVYSRQIKALAQAVAETLIALRKSVR